STSVSRESRINDLLSAPRTRRRYSGFFRAGRCRAPVVQPTSFDGEALGRRLPSLALFAVARLDGWSWASLTPSHADKGVRFLRPTHPTPGRQFVGWVERSGPTAPFTSDSVSEAHRVLDPRATPKRARRALRTRSSKLDGPLARHVPSYAVVGPPTSARPS